MPMHDKPVLQRRTWILEYVMVGITTSVAAYFRLVGLPCSELTTDEAFSWRLTTFDVGESLCRTAMDVHPPLYYLVLRGWLMMWGTSATSLRALSALAGIAVVPAFYVLLRTAFSRSASQESCLRARQVALAGAIVVALLPLQIEASRTARMYSVGAGLTVVASVLLLRALRAYEQPYRWWALYALVSASLCYTHNFGLLCVGAQLAGALVFLRCSANTKGLGWRKAAELGVAAALVFTMYSVWVPVLYAQAGEVRENYWIPDLTLRELRAMVFRWGTGLPYLGVTAWCAWGVMSLWVTVRAWRTSPALCGFFLVPALVPWLVGISVFLITGRSIVEERYLVFGQLGAVGVWATCMFGLRSATERAVLLGCSGVLLSVAVAALHARIPRSLPPSALAFDYIKDGYRSGDLILASNLGDVHRFRLLAVIAGIPGAVVKVVPTQISGNGHTPQSAAITDEDLLSENDPILSGTSRIWWCAGAAPAYPDGLQGRVRAVERHTLGFGAQRVSVVRFAMRGVPQ